MTETGIIETTVSFVKGEMRAQAREEVQLEDALCPLGCNRDDELILMGRDRINGLPGEFAVVQCRSCGLMRTNPRPTRESIGYYYPDNYGPYLGTRIAKRRPSARSGVKKVLRPLLQWTFDTKVSSLPSLSPGRLLEIGCASGSFLHRMAGQGWRVEGIESSERAASAARAQGYRVQVGLLEDAAGPDHEVDLIYGAMVLEHLHDPVRCLEKLHRWAKRDAWLVLSVPNVASWDFRLFRDANYALHLPNHLYHFSPSTLHTVLGRAGWKAERVFHQRVLSNYFGSLGHVLSDRGHDGSITRWLEAFPRKAGPWHFWLFPFARVLAALGQTGRMTVWARRADA